LATPPPPHKFFIFIFQGEEEDPARPPVHGQPQVEHASLPGINFSKLFFGLKLFHPQILEKYPPKTTDVNLCEYYG
jgi:hypothetical protein